MSIKVIFTPEAEAQLIKLYRDIAVASSTAIASGYTEGIVTYCESLKIFPQRGIARHDIRPDMRITNYRRRTIIAFSVDTERVAIIGIFYGGQNYETLLFEGGDEE